MAILDEGRMLAVACERSGEIKVIDPGTGRIMAEKKLGDRIGGLASLPESTKAILVAVAGPDQLMLVAAGRTIEILSTHPLSGSPKHLAVSTAGQISVGLPDLQFLERCELSADGFTGKPGISMDFTPGRQLFLPDGRLVVADAFGGRLAVIDASNPGSVIRLTETPFHNISGLTIAPSGDRILLSHQRSSALAQGNFDDLHWGSLMRNEVSSLPADLAGDADRTLALGDVGDAAGDPAGIAIGSDWRIFVALAGVDQIGILSPGRAAIERLPVGQRPREVLLDEPRRRLYVANSLSDTISVVNIDLGKITSEFRVAPESDPTSRDRGERLFFDARQSHDGWMSCHSCHTDGHSNGRLVDTQGDGSLGDPKRVLSLLGIRGTVPFAWNGSVPDLKTQVEKSFETTLHRGELMDEASLDDLVVFLESLEPPSPVSIPAGEKVSADRGRILFADKLRCGRCHDPAHGYTSAEIYDVGLTDRAGNRKFNPPSLRGVGRREPLFHDGRADKLDRVFSVHQHGLEGRQLEAGELADLLAFLRSL